MIIAGKTSSLTLSQTKGSQELMEYQGEEEDFGDKITKPEE